MAMGATGLDNDTRGWIMTALSGIGECRLTFKSQNILLTLWKACMLGASIICIDLLVRQIPHRSCRDFRIQDSNLFLSSSLSLSFGVMVSFVRI
jgi:ZIP family zinc transporter